MSTDETDEPIGGLDNSLPRPSYSVRLAVEYLVKCIADDHGCRAGTTAAYWNLLWTAQQHMKHEQGK